MTKTAPTPIDPLALMPSTRSARPAANGETASQFDALLTARRRQDAGLPVSEPGSADAAAHRSASPDGGDRKPRQKPVVRSEAAERQPDTRPDLMRAVARDQTVDTVDVQTTQTVQTAPAAQPSTAEAQVTTALAQEAVDPAVQVAATTEAGVAPAAPTAIATAAAAEEAVALLDEQPEVAEGEVDPALILAAAGVIPVLPAAPLPNAVTTATVAVDVAQPLVAAPGTTPVVPAAPSPATAPTDAGGTPAPILPATAPTSADDGAAAAAALAAQQQTTAQKADTKSAQPTPAASGTPTAPVQPQPQATSTPTPAPASPALAQLADDLAKLAPETPVVIQAAAAAAPKPAAQSGQPIDGRSIMAIADAARSGKPAGTLIDRPVDAIVRVAATPLIGEPLVGQNSLADLPPQAAPRFSGASAFSQLPTLGSGADFSAATPSPTAAALPTQTQGAQATHAPQAASHTRPGRPMPVIDQVATGVFRAATEGTGKVQIALTPQNLGRVEVDLEIREGGHVVATVTAERPETLDLLRRDAHALERALSDAGLKTDSGSLQFGLKGQQREDDLPQQRRGGRNGGGLAADGDDDAMPVRQQRYGGALGGVDVTI
ncbi:MAG: hypothetical protein EAZ99_02690 [Alphaproteobacteria bacterium]|nr:MAG: hypothetical protein EAZ99_02690 [Alphaproteobacteria bacterium]